jgi:hypothetical protein
MFHGKHWRKVCLVDQHFSARADTNMRKLLDAMPWDQVEKRINGEARPAKAGIFVAERLDLPHVLSIAA